jgi:hypothetical protein
MDLLAQLAASPGADGCPTVKAKASEENAPIMKR